MAGVAQLVEHQIVALVAAGSSPVARPQKAIQRSCIAFYIDTLGLCINYVYQLRMTNYVSFL